MSNRTMIAAALTASVLISAPLALAGTGDDLREGVRNPSSGNASRETQVIARTGKDVYGTRQSNTGAGGGAIYGCRSTLDTAAIGDPKRSTPCLRVNNLRDGKAFDFQAKAGRIAGIIQVGNSLTTPIATSAPFVTNATAVAVGLNADRVDGLNAADIIAQATAAAQAAAGAGSTGCPASTVLAGGGCIETAQRAAATYANAAAACGQAGRRLVPPDVLLSARTLDGIDLAGGEMSADVTVDGVSLVTNAITRGYTTVADDATVASAALGAPSPFRCITS